MIQGSRQLNPRTLAPLSSIDALQLNLAVNRLCPVAYQLPTVGTVWCPRALNPLWIADHTLQPSAVHAAIRQGWTLCQLPAEHGVALLPPAPHLALLCSNMEYGALRAAQVVTTEREDLLPDSLSATLGGTSLAAQLRTALSYHCDTHDAGIMMPAGLQNTQIDHCLQAGGALMHFGGVTYLCPAGVLTDMHITPEELHWLARHGLAAYRVWEEPQVRGTSSPQESRAIAHAPLDVATFVARLQTRWHAPRQPVVADHRITNTAAWQQHPAFVDWLIDHHAVLEPHDLEQMESWLHQLRHANSRQRQGVILRHMTGRLAEIAFRPIILARYDALVLTDPALLFFPGHTYRDGAGRFCSDALFAHCDTTTRTPTITIVANMEVTITQDQTAKMDAQLQDFPYRVERGICLTNGAAQAICTIHNALNSPVTAWSAVLPPPAAAQIRAIIAAFDSALRGAITPPTLRASSKPVEITLLSQTPLEWRPVGGFAEITVNNLNQFARDQKKYVPVGTHLIICGLVQSVSPLQIVGTGVTHTMPEHLHSGYCSITVEYTNGGTWRVIAIDRPTPKGRSMTGGNSFVLIKALCARPGFEATSHEWLCRNHQGSHGVRSLYQGDQPFHGTTTRLLNQWAAEFAGITDRRAPVEIFVGFHMESPETPFIALSIATRIEELREGPNARKTFVLLQRDAKSRWSLDLPPGTGRSKIGDVINSFRAMRGVRIPSFEFLTEHVLPRSLSQLRDPAVWATCSEATLEQWAREWGNTLQRPVHELFLSGNFSDSQHIKGVMVHAEAPDTIEGQKFLVRFSKQHDAWSATLIKQPQRTSTGAIKNHFYYSEEIHALLRQMRGVRVDSLEYIDLQQGSHISPLVQAAAWSQLRASQLRRWARELALHIGMSEPLTEFFASWKSRPERNNSFSSFALHPQASSLPETSNFTHLRIHRHPSNGRWMYDIVKPGISIAIYRPILDACLAFTQP